LPPWEAKQFHPLIEVICDPTTYGGGFSVYVYSRTQKVRVVKYGLGKLSSGETFVLVDRRKVPYFYIRVKDPEKARSLLEKARVSWCRTDFQPMKGEAIIKVYWQNYGPLRKLIDNLELVIGFNPSFLDFPAQVAANKAAFRIINTA